MAFTNESDSEMVTKTVAVAQNYTAELYEYLVSLLPKPAGLTELSNRMEVNYPAVLRGDPEGEKAFQADREAVNSELNLLLGLARVLSVKDPAVQEKLGLGKVPERAPATPIPLTAPQNFQVEYDPNGDPVGTATKVPGARTYQIWACDGDPGTEANWKLVGSSDKNKRIVIAGHNRGKLNLLRIRAMRGNHAGPWSNWIGFNPK